MKLISLKYCFFIIALILSGWANAQVYKWVDEHGKVHFGDKPPAKADAEALDLPEVNRSETPEVSDAERIERQRRLVQALEEEREQKQKARDEKKKKKAERMAACKQLNGRIKHSDTVNRFFKYDEEGERTYISDDDADAFRKRLREAYKKNCES